MHSVVLIILTFISCIFLSCGKNHENSTNTVEISESDIELLLLENKNESFLKIFNQNSVVLLFPTLVEHYNGRKIILDYALLPGGKLSKPFPSSPCGIDVNGSWNLQGNKIITTGSWNIPKKNCESDFLTNIEHIGKNREFQHEIYNFSKNLKESGKLTVHVKGIGIAQVLIQ